jgi:PBSX family phage terminase large subunit
MSIKWGKFSEKALDFIANSHARICILDGSVRSSKTVNVDVRWLTYLVTGPQGDLFMIGKTQATLKRNVLNDIFDIVGPKNYHWVDRQQGELILLGRRVFCVGANNEDAESKIRGATSAGALCDEANLYPQSFFNQLMARMSIEGAQCFCTLNPDSPYHWFYTDVIMNDKIIDKQRWHFTLDDNLTLSKSYIDSLKQMYTGLFYKRFIDGEWCIAEGAIYDMYSTEKNVKSIDLEKKPPYRYIIACDYGTSTVMSWSKIVCFADGTFYKVEEYYYDALKERRQKTDSQFANEFDQFVKNIPYGFLFAIYCDPSAASWKAELRYRGYVVQDAENDVVNGIRYVSSLLSFGRYVIDPDCVYTNKEYPSYAWDAEAQKYGVDKPIKQFDHSCDSDRYALYTYSLYASTGVYTKRGS